MSVQVENLSKFYGQQKAVDSISFEVKEGEILGFLGPNGAGKSTTMKILTGFLPPSDGIARICGHDVVSDAINSRKYIGYLPENNPLYLEMYIKEYLEYVASIYAVPTKKRAVNEAIEMTGLGKESKKKIGQLSKGFRQRVGLAQALIHDPKVLILDEPTTGLDPNQLGEIRQLIRQLGKNKTVILSTHIMQEVEALCDRVLIINQGKMVVDASVKKLLGHENAHEIFIAEFENPFSPQYISELIGLIELELINDRTFRIISTSGSKIREQIFELAVKKENSLLGLRKEENSLEQIFKKLTK